MKISEITTLLNRVKAVTYQEKFIPFDDLNCDNSMKKLNEMISTLEQLAERMRVHTITDDPATWPPIGVLTLGNDKGRWFWLRRTHEWNESDKLNGCQWQYLPDWSEE